ncbi:AbrB/MazE/SpoVT family DNA-binding domain-containing protein [Hyperthermus butylicus]|uniref:SpoVT-AbrB domain-containing protein n=1 Tax=Hyperthermus butylicus (strain DSM 5456 / JCM 9403 / PLM1-5) TaxID=415426 RepID=A2BMZ4_HYPBU|nr:AbrB/MazE/SpoVT family DNA-binding domain-containing protein [Hyperthermus butylicus]ABM81355.1 hypothetical protein Hbut_1533 [Hyperthermus butylicus DSM 5456]
MEIIARVDKKGRVLIPSEIRFQLGIRNAVKIRVENNKLIIEPVKDPIEAPASTVPKGTHDVEAEINELRQTAAREAMQRLRERWF